jgi:predicted exporter
VSLAARWALGAWLAGVATCVAVIARTEFSTDLSAFLPRSPSPVQQVLVEQLRNGVVSRLILIGIEGDTPDRLAQTSKRLATSLRASGSFASVNNGADAGFENDRDFLWRNRYLLSPTAKAERFLPGALRESLEDALLQLASPAGVLLQRILPADPTDELIGLLEQFAHQARPRLQSGVWFSREGSRALLIAQTRAEGSDIDAQERALAMIRNSFEQARAAGEAKLLLTGPGVFSVASRERIRHDAWRLSLIATTVIAAMLLALYRSVRVLGLGFLPVASGALAGIAAVSLAFGSVHGITLAFGVTLIGEGVDYAIYLFTQNVPGAAPQTTFERIWPTLRLGVLTSICGFSAMLFSDFTGLAQLGLFSVAGLVVAAAVTRWILPALLPRGFVVTAVAAFAPKVMALVRAAPRLRYPVLVVLTVTLAFLLMRPQPLWSGSLASLSPVSPGEQALDQQLRQDIGAPEVRYLVVVHARDEQAALQASEHAAMALREAMAQGWLQGFDSPAAYLPSRATQRARRDALPAAETLRQNLRVALKGLPFRSNVFEPFVRDVSAARSMPLLERSSLQGTSLALKLDSLLVKRESGWAAMLSLRGVTNVEAIVSKIGKSSDAQVVLLDLKHEADQLYRTYLREALTNSLLGAAAIVILLFASLRSPRRVFDVLAPLAAAVLVTCGLLVVSGIELSIFHLVGLLLVVAVGSNYSLFFDRRAPSGQDRSRTIVSLLFAAVSTLVGFGLLALSKVPVLSGIGSTVGMGAAMALVFSAIMSRKADPEGAYARNP